MHTDTETNGYNLTTTINNFKLSYDDVGEGRIPVIFLHGFPFDKSMWHIQLDYLSSSYRLIACDIRGFGKSIDEETPLSMDLFADDLLKFMDNLSIDKAVICGFSMGGFIALNAINRFPDRFVALVLCDTQCKPDTPEVRQKRYTAIDTIKANGVTGFNDGFIKKVFHKDSLKNKKDLVKQLKSIVNANSPHVICEGLTAMAERSETCSGLVKISVPTLVICGRDDEVTPLAQSEFMHDNIKGSILKVIDLAGHVSNLEQQVEFNKTLGSFLSGLDGVSIEFFSWN
jgi:pimeloyl-ACP methyl ester carboxylesterase